MSEVDTARPQADYRPADGFFDELFDADGSPRPDAAALTEALRLLGLPRCVSRPSTLGRCKRTKRRRWNP